MTEDEHLGCEWLRGRGYDVEFEPKLVAAGKSPDFLATARGSTLPPAIWAEVKSIAPDARRTVQANTWPLLRGLGVPQGLSGSAVLRNPSDR